MVHRGMRVVRARLRHGRGRAHERGLVRMRHHAGRCVERHATHGCAAAPRAAVVAVVAAIVGAEEVFALHLALEAGDVAVAEVLAQLLHLLQLEQVYSQHLDGFDHLKSGTEAVFPVCRNDFFLNVQTHEIVDFLIVCEEGFALAVLVLDESLYIQVETLGGGTF